MTDHRRTPANDLRRTIEERVRYLAAVISRERGDVTPAERQAIRGQLQKCEWVERRRVAVFLREAAKLQGALSDLGAREALEDAADAIEKAEHVKGGS